MAATTNLVDPMYARNEIVNTNVPASTANDPATRPQQTASFQSHPTQSCSICLDESNSKDDRLITPCKCTGSSKYVHTICLAAYRLHRPFHKSYSKCPTCNYTYKFRRLHFLDIMLHPAMATTAITILSILAFGYIFVPLFLIIAIPGQVFLSGPVNPPLWDTPLFTQRFGWIDHIGKGISSLGLLGIAMFVRDFAKICWTGRAYVPLWWTYVFATSMPMTPYGPFVTGSWRVVMGIWHVVEERGRRLRGECEKERVLEYEEMESRS